MSIVLRGLRAFGHALWQASSATGARESEWLRARAQCSGGKQPLSLEGKHLKVPKLVQIAKGETAKICSFEHHGKRFIAKIGFEPMLHTEAAVLKALPHHPNIVEFEGMCRVNGEWALAFPGTTTPMEVAQDFLLDNESPENYFMLVEKYLRDIGAGLQALSKKGIYQGDHKLWNTVYDGRSHTFRIIDFYTAELTDPKDPGSAIRAFKRLGMKGTPGFKAPEFGIKALRDPKASPRRALAKTDAYALGVGLKRLIDDGNRQFDKPGGGSKAWKHHRDLLTEVADKLCAENAAKRWTAGQAIAYLESKSGGRFEGEIEALIGRLDDKYQ